MHGSHRDFLSRRSELHRIAQQIVKGMRKCIGSAMMRQSSGLESRAINDLPPREVG